MPIARAGEKGEINYDPTRVLSKGEDAVPAPGHKKGGVPDDVKSIKGWGVDLDFARRNVFPMELPSKVNTARGDVKHWQVARSTIDISNEMPGLTPVFGDTLPPKGLSGMLRNYAYEYGEGTSRHWMGLILADRIERVEVMIADALKGRGDNLFAEKALGAKFKYRNEHNRNRRNDSTTIATVAAVGALVLGLAVWKKMADRD